MAKIPMVVEKRLKTEIPKFQKILDTAKSRDINEADTVVIIMDILEQVFGFDKYEDLTREFTIKGTYVDLAVVTKNKIDYLIEVKAIGIELKESHLRQAIDYAAKEGVKWAVLTNGIHWEVHRVTVDGQVSNENILKFNFLELSTRSSQDMDILFLLCKKGVTKDLIEEYYEHKQILNRYTVGTILTSDDVVKVVKRTLKKINTGLKVDDEQIKQIITNNVLKREIIEGEQAKEAQKMIKRTFAKIERQKKIEKTTP